MKAEVLWSRTTPMSSTNSLGVPLELKAHNTTELCSAGWHWRRRVVTPGALHMQGMSPHSCFVGEHWESALS